MKVDTESLISVIVPAYNVQGMIGECVASILAQTHRNLEVIAVNDRSMDDTGSILDELAAGDDRLKIVHLPINIGLHAARVQGLKVATGMVIGFVDGDDVVGRNMFSSLIEALVRHDADIALCGYAKVHAKDRSVLRSHGFKTLEVHTSDLLGRYARGEYHSGVMWNKLYRRELLLRNAMIALDRSVDSGADYIIGIGCFADATRIVVIPEVEYQYIAHPESMSRAVSKAEHFAFLLRFYVTCLQVHEHRRNERFEAIDTLYGRHFRFIGLPITDKHELTPLQGHLSDSLSILAAVYPEGVYTLVHVFDNRTRRVPVMPLRYSLGQVRLALRQVLRSVANKRFK